jgi:peptide/nickel transport system ATP-binding protein
MTNDDVLLSVRNLKKHYPITQGVLDREIGRVRAVDGISFDVHRGETVGLVGESGCGKSTAATSIIQLEDPTDGEVIFNDKHGERAVGNEDVGGHPNDVTSYDGKDLKRFRRQAQMIFQDPSSSLDPRMTIGESVAEPLRVHGLNDKETRRTIVKDLLERVGMSAEDYLRYPHEFSGGQKQRIGLARALVLNPELIVADEPVSALDVSVQAEILALINELKDEFELSMLFISHDMSVIREVCDRVAVMYLGEIVEIGQTEELFQDPQHPYTQALLSSIPQPDPRAKKEEITLTGDVPSPSNPPSGCRFHTRCHKVIQPDDYDFEQENWTSVVNFRARVGNRRLDVEAAREFARTEMTVQQQERAGEGGGTEVSLDEVPDEDVKAVLRDEFDLPDRLDSPQAEQVLSDALDYVIEEDFESAQQLLADEFESVCDSTTPEYRDIGSGREAACHLHDETTNAEMDSRQSPSPSD